MDEQAIRKYAQLMHELDLSALEINENGVRLERAASGTAPAPIGAIAQDAADNTVAGLVNVCSPMVGMFYSAPAENAAPFVQVGDEVRKGDVLCVIEAMKLMNEITSDYDGVIAEVCVDNGQIVDFGHLMFRIRKEQP